MIELELELELGLDEELALRIQRGDEAALEMLVRRYHSQIHAYVVRMGGEYHMASDITQEVFIKVCRHICQYRTDLSFRPWIYTIACNTYKDHLRKAYVQKDFLGSEPEELTADMDTPETAFMETVERRMVIKVLQQMGEIYREVLILRYYQDLKLDEIALAVQIPVGTVKSRLSAALRQLKQLLLKEDGFIVDSVKR